MPSDREPERGEARSSRALPSSTSERWERERAHGRTHFILRRGVLGWGIPAAVLAILYKVVQEQGFSRSPHLTGNLRGAIAVAIVVFPVCGWLFGRWLWDTGEARYRARVRDRDRDGA